MVDPDLIGSPIQLQLLDPVTATVGAAVPGRWSTTPSIEPNPTAVVSNVQMKCKDMFDYLARAEMVLGVCTATPYRTPECDGAVFWEDGPVDTRIEDLLGDRSAPG